MAKTELDYMEYSSDANAQAAYVTNDATNLQSYSESTIKTQGSYALKGIAAATDSLNKTLTKTFSSPIDLSGQNQVIFDLRSSRTGANLKFGLKNIRVDSYTKLASHFDGANEATAYTDPIAGAATFVGTAQLSTAQKVFGTASLLLDGNSDYITYPDSDSWDFGSGDFTVDAFIRFGAIGVEQCFVSQFEDSNNQFQFYISNANKLGIYDIDGGVIKGWYLMTSAWSGLAVDTWYHIAFERTTTTAKIFINGVSQTLTANNAFGTNDLGNHTAVLVVGGVSTAPSFNGYIDELRISKGIARWTSDFTPPTTSYTDVTTELTPTISSADTFETKTFDLSGVSDYDKNNITSLIITVVNADAANTFYIDNMFAGGEGLVQCFIL